MVNGVLREQQGKKERPRMAGRGTWGVITGLHVNHLPCFPGRPSVKYAFLFKKIPISCWCITELDFFVGRIHSSNKYSIESLIYQAVF